MWRVYVAVKCEANFAGRDWGGALDGRRNGRAAFDEGDPACAVPALEAMTFDAALLIVVPSADGLDKRNDIEALFFCEVDFYPIQGPGPSSGYQLEAKLPSFASSGPTVSG